MQKPNFEDRKGNLLKKFFHSIIFLAVFLVILHFITPFFIPKWISEYGEVTQKIRGIYSEKNNTIDVVILGNSDANWGISTMKLWEEYGISSWNLATSMQTSWTSYHLLKEICNYQKPKLIVFETDCLFEKKDRSKRYVAQVYDNMKFGINKLEGIFDPSYKNSLVAIVSYFFPLSRYHTRWNELTEEDFKYAYKEYVDKLKGSQITKEVEPYNGEPNYLEVLNSKYNEIPEISKRNFEKIVEFCEENDIKIFMVELPTTTSWSEKQGQLVTEYARMKNIEFVDLNIIINDLGIDFKKHTKDSGNHLNIEGAEIVTSFIGEKISNNYNIPNHKDDKKYEQWNNDLITYKELKK